MILEEFDPCKTAVIDPDMVADKIEDFPDVTVSCFSWKLFENQECAPDWTGRNTRCIKA